jgi:hypothetical protein
MSSCKHLSIDNTPIAGQPTIRGICAIKADPKNLARTVKIIKAYKKLTGKTAVPNNECPFFMSKNDFAKCPEYVSTGPSKADEEA